MNTTIRWTQCVRFSLIFSLATNVLCTEASAADTMQLQSAAAVSQDLRLVAAATPAQDTKPAEPPSKPSDLPKLRGFIQTEIARTIASPSHWSKVLTRAELGAQGGSGEGVKWKVGARADYDAVYDLTNYYPAEVRRDQRLNFSLRENYIDFNAANWDFRLGKQQIVWGEVVGFFVADVVSAKDMREFILMDFEMLRIPQWAARAEYSANDFHAELLWVPVASYDKIGKPGAEFFPPLPPAPPGFASVYRGETRPTRDLANTNYGARVGTLVNGWDLAGFYYRSTDASPTFFRQVVTSPQPAFVYDARHERIHQFGATVTKDIGSVVLKGEAVYTRGRQFNVLRVSDDNGVVPQSTIDWVAGLDFTLPLQTRFNVQLFQRIFRNADPDILSKERESGYTLLLNTKLTDRVEAQMLWIASLDRSDWLLRPKVTWNFEKNWRWTAGADVFHGPPQGLFGRFENRDRVYTELRYSF